MTWNLTFWCVSSISQLFCSLSHFPTILIHDSLSYTLTHPYRLIALKIIYSELTYLYRVHRAGIRIRRLPKHLLHHVYVRDRKRYRGPQGIMLKDRDRGWWCDKRGGPRPYPRKRMATCVSRGFKRTSRCSGANAKRGCDPTGSSPHISRRTIIKNQSRPRSCCPHGLAAKFQIQQLLEWKKRSRAECQRSCSKTCKWGGSIQHSTLGR